MKPRYSFVVPLRDDELDDAINRLYCGCLLSLAERERIAAWMETKRVYAVPEALRSEDDPFAMQDAWNSAIDAAAMVAWNHEPDVDGPIETAIRALRLKPCAPSPLARSQEES